jgi:hypothetical protein
MNDLDRLLAIEEIKQLKARYFRFVDTKDWTGLRTVFCESAQFFVSQEQIRALNLNRGEPIVESLRGPDAIVRFISDALHEADSVHHGFMPEIDVTSDHTARGVWAMEDHVRWPTKSLHGMGHYIETYERVESIWRILSFRIVRLRVEIL